MSSRMRFRRRSKHFSTNDLSSDESPPRSKTLVKPDQKVGSEAQGFREYRIIAFVKTLKDNKRVVPFHYSTSVYDDLRPIVCVNP